MKLIIRAPNWVGDAVMALTAIDNAKEITGASQLAIMARKATAPLFRNRPEVDNIIEIDDKSSAILGPKRTADLIKKEAYDVGLLFPPSFSSALIFKLAKVTGRIGYATDNRSLLLTRAIPYPQPNMHRLHSYLYLLEKLTGRKPDAHSPKVYLSSDDIQAGEKILREYGLSYDDSYVAIAPRAIGESRRWGSDNYGRLASRICSDFKTPIVLVGALGDSEEAEKIRSFAPERIFNLCGATSLMSAAAILSFAKLFIGNDSGLAHLAGAVNCPLVVLSGADNPKETSPVCGNKVVIIKDIDCISCAKNKCFRSGDDFMRCMKLITVDEVFNAAKGKITL